MGEILHHLGGFQIFSLSKASIKVICSEVENSFWKEVILSWAETMEEPKSPEDFLREPLWNSIYIKIDKSIFNFKKWIEKGIKVVNDLIDETGWIYTIPDFITRYKLQDSDGFRVLSLMSAIPGEWKLKLRDYGRKLTNTWHTSVKNLFESKKTVKYIYKMFIEKKAAIPKKSQEKWYTIIPELKDNVKKGWSAYYRVTTTCTIEAKLRSFQYKILNRVYATNNFLYKCKILPTDLCSFCSKEKEINIFFGYVIL